MSPTAADLQPSMFASTGTTTLVLVLVLVLIGVAMVLLTIWLLRTTRADPRALGPLEVMGQRRWAQADTDARAAALAAARPPGAPPPEPMLEYEAVEYDRPLTPLAEAEAQEAVAAEEAAAQEAADAPHGDRVVTPSAETVGELADADTIDAVAIPTVVAAADPDVRADATTVETDATTETYVDHDEVAADDGSIEAAVAADAVEEASAVETVTEANAAAAALAVVEDDADADAGANAAARDVESAAPDDVPAAGDVEPSVGGDGAGEDVAAAAEEPAAVGTPAARWSGLAGRVRRRRH